MATNVSEKDKPIREIIDYCKARSKEEQDFARGTFDSLVRSWAMARSGAYDRIAIHCESMLGYSGSMPSEVPNQSEDAK